MKSMHIWLFAAIALGAITLVWRAADYARMPLKAQGNGSTRAHADTASLLETPALCTTRADCNNNGACLSAECTCAPGFAGIYCDRCSTAHHGYPECKADATCYALSWDACTPPTPPRLLRNEGLLPHRPRRQISLVSASDALDPNTVLGVQIVDGLWGKNTISLKVCHVNRCGAEQQGGGRICKWEETTEQIYVRNTGCGVDVMVKPRRASGAGAGFKGECTDADDQAELLCTLPSKRYKVYARDVSWLLEKDASGGYSLEAAGWRGHYLIGGHTTALKHGKPHPEREGRLRLHTLGQKYLASCNTSST